MPLVIDTNVVRHIGAGEVDPSGLSEVVREGVTVHLADGAFVELTHQLLTRSLKWDHWERARKILLEPISRDKPVLPGGREGLIGIGITGLQPTLPGEIEAGLELYDAAWTMLVAANQYEDFEKMSIRLPNQGCSVSLNQEYVLATYAKQRDSWPIEFASFYEKVIEVSPELPDSLPTRGDSAETLEIWLKSMREKVDANHQSTGPRLSTRLDAFLRVSALLDLRHLRKDQRYNPQKNRNDLFDHELLRYLAVPAAVCTGDLGLIAKVRDSHSWQIGWIFQVEDLLRPDVRAGIKNMEWPDEAA